MRYLILGASLSALLLILLTGSPTWARTDTDEARLETVRKDIDKETTQKAQNVQVQALAKEFNVSPGVVESLRAQKQGWGEITIQLAMAEHLSQTDPKTYPTTTDALRKIETLRSEKMGWGQVANELGFKLGPVVSAAERVEHVERPDHAQRPDRSERPEKPERPEKR